MKRFLLTICCAALVLIATPSQAASLAPAVLEVSAKRGEVVDQIFRVFNTSAAEQTYFLGVMKFSASDESGTPQFIPYDQDHSELPEWIQFPSTEIRVASNSYVEVPFQIVLPDDIASGGYYAGITVSNAPSDVVATNGALIEAKTAMLVLLTIEGETDQTWGLLDFLNGSKTFASSFAGTYTYRVQNQGNTHVSPEGSVLLKDLFGRTLNSMDANVDEGRVLPGTTRIFRVEGQGVDGFWKNAWEQTDRFAVGPVYAHLELDFADQRYTEKVMGFWYVPWQLFAVALVLILLIGSVYRGARKT